MVKYDYFNEELRLIRAYSDNNKYLNEYDNNGNLLKEGEYEEAVNYGYIIENVGIFDNGNFYLESEVDIPIVVEENVSQETI